MSRGDDPASLRKTLEIDLIFSEAEWRTHEQQAEVWQTNEWEAMAFEAVKE